MPSREAYSGTAVALVQAGRGLPRFIDPFWCNQAAF